MPNSKYYLFWEFFMTIFTVVIIFLESLKVFYYIKPEDKVNFPTNHIALKDCTIILFILDCIKNFFTAYYQKGNLVLDLRKISEIYLTGYFIVDVLSFFGFCISTSSYMDNSYSVGSFSNWARILFFFKIFTTKMIFNRLE